MNNMSKKLLAGTAVAAFALAGSIGTTLAQDKPTIATVVKISGIPWFDRMNTGVVAFQEGNPDVIATQSGPATADSAQQLQIVNDLVAKGVNALAVVPMDPAVLEGTFERAMERGIVVGTLTATGFLRASKAVEGMGTLDTAAMANFWRAYCDGVAERGKAKVGEKTLLDVLEPIAATLEEQSTVGASLADALKVTADAAARALEATKSMVAQRGKAAAFPEKSVGLQDAGATVGYFMIRRLAEFVAAG